MAIATETQPALAFDKAFYRPGEVVTLQIAVPQGAQIEATITHLSVVVDTLTAPVVDGTATLTLTPPPDAPRGYGIDLTVKDANGQTVTTLSTAFDVLERWIDAPRYGFLSDFEPGRTNFEETAQWAARYHINGLQFYDWQYRHEALLPPPNTDIYADLLGKRMSYNVVTELINAAHTRNIAAMPYTAIYGASKGFYDEHPDMALLQSSGEPFRFGDDFLIIMNPAAGSKWTAHMMAEFADVLDKTTFDGIHIDQYGAPKNGFDSDGNPVEMSDAFPAFVNTAAQVVHEKRGDDGVTIFNLVGNYPVETVAPSDEDAVYIEVWSPHRNFMDLYKIIAKAQALGGGKPVIIAAYIHPDRPINVRLANALIFAAGGYYLQLGEPGALLADPYFPKYGMMDEALQTVLARYFDFMVRYENILALNTTDATAERADALTIDGVTTKSLRSRDRVATLVRKGEGFETFSLINLLDIGQPYWNEPVTSAPTPLINRTVKLYISGIATTLWLASPDSDNFALEPVTFTPGHDDAGDFVTFTLPRLDYWTMLFVDYAA